MFQTKVPEKIKIQILCPIAFFFRKSFCLWDNVEKYGTAGQATDGEMAQRMRFACWITKATDTHSEYVILLLFHRNNSYANAPQYYVQRALPVLLILCVSKSKRADERNSTKKPHWNRVYWDEEFLQRNGLMFASLWRSGIKNATVTRGCGLWVTSQ